MKNCVWGGQGGIWMWNLKSISFNFHSITFRSSGQWYGNYLMHCWLVKTVFARHWRLIRFTATLFDLSAGTSHIVSIIYQWYPHHAWSLCCGLYINRRYWRNCISLITIYIKMLSMFVFYMWLANTSSVLENTFSFTGHLYSNIDPLVSFNCSNLHC